jgi:cobalt-zinc-cadmium resistance protein CzcA
MMNVFGVTANLMSLGAIDFGLIVDGAVIVVEAIVYRLSLRQADSVLTSQEMDEMVTDASTKIRTSAAFGEIIILIVYLPILALAGIEGKTFAPMAQTVIFAIFGALVLSLTYVPMMSALLLSKKNIKHGGTISDKIIHVFQRIYTSVLNVALQFKMAIIAVTVILFGFTYWQFSNLGGEFMPTLEEGDLALHQILPPGSSLEKSVEVSTKLQDIIMENFPEVEQVVTKIGTAEIPTDLMSMETGDIMVILKPKSEWTSAKSREELVQKMEKKMSELPGIAYEFTQPIQMRFNELMTGSRADIAIKIYGDDLTLLFQNGKKVEKLIENLEGVSSVTVDQLIGMPQIIIRYDYNKLAQYGLQIKSVNTIVRTAFAGEKAGVIYEGDRRFDLVVRMPEHLRKDIDNVRDLLIPLENGQTIPLTQIAAITLEKAPMQIARDNTKRRITIGANVLNRDIASLVAEIESVLDEKLDLPPGYYITYGGQFENLQNATKRLGIAVPAALLLIFSLLYLTFNSLKQAALIFTAIPLAAIGGVWALIFRGMPFSISAGIGFIALFGVAVLNGIVLIGYFNQLKKEGITNVRERIITGTKVRLRPVIMTALVASLGFLPMALSNSGGAEVQRPLATVVIGGLITATLLTLVVLPILYSWIEKDENTDLTD